MLGALAPLHGAQAQGGGACEQLKASLAARIDPSIGGFSLEVVPASTAVPAGAKVIGTCEGGARKVLLRRQAAGVAGDAAGAANAPASAAAAVAEAPTKARRAALAAAERASAAETAAAKVAGTGAAAVPEPARESAPAKPAPAPPSAKPLPAVPTPVATVAPASASTASQPQTRDPVNAVAESASAVQPADPATQPVPAQDAAPATPLLQRAAALAAQYWLWLVGLALVLLAAPLGAWIAHRRAYDAAGLPRGPRLN